LALHNDVGDGDAGRGELHVAVQIAPTPFPFWRL